MDGVNGPPGQRGSPGERGYPGQPGDDGLLGPPGLPGLEVSRMGLKFEKIFLSIVAIQCVSIHFLFRRVGLVSLDRLVLKVKREK